MVITLSPIISVQVSKLLLEVTTMETFSYRSLIMLKNRLASRLSMGYIPIDRHGAHLFFQLVSRRYEKGALILTSNRSFLQWNEIFGDPVIATTILDRILHHSTTINIKGNSYRLREKVKAGLIREPEAEES